jgi:hypothetical protein
MNNTYTEAFSENLFSQQYEYKQKYTSNRKHVSKDSSKGFPEGTYDKAREKASRVKNDYRLVHGYREVRASKREWRDE